MINWLNPVEMLRSARAAAMLAKGLSIAAFAIRSDKVCFKYKKTRSCQLRVSDESLEVEASLAAVKGDIG